MTIAWQTRSELLYNSICNQELALKANGGNAYDFQAAMALQGKFQLAADKTSVYTTSDNPGSYWLRMRGYDPKADFRILEPYPIVFGGKFRQSKNIAMIHHIDDHAENGGLKHKWFYKRLFKRIKRFDKVVTVSEYWKQYLHGKGCENVHIIYNSFDPSGYRFDSNQLKEFRETHGFSNERPLIYIGNASNGKGVHQAYAALKNSDYQLVMTGGTNRATDIPVKFLSLSALDYRKLIACCDVALTMSNMMEGWNRVAHEAMLSGVPVIGSGSGGMRELLEGGKQLITTQFEQLPEMIRSAIDNKTEMADNGYKFVSKFDQEYFEKSWRSIIQ